MIKKFFIKTINLLSNSLRLFLGPPGCCIYPVTCRNYAKLMMQQKPLYLSIPFIIFRILSCNPMTAIFIRIMHHVKSKS